jgi:hypothetical protein
MVVMETMIVKLSEEIRHDAHTSPPGRAVGP